MCDIQIRLWKPGEDDKYIPAYIKSYYDAFKNPTFKYLDEEWFHWKFEKSPYGPAIIACAFEGDELVGCTAFGIGFYMQNGEKKKCALPYSVFVVHRCAGKSIFTRLLTFVEMEAEKRGVALLYAFPNKNSLPGFIRRKYILQNDDKCYLVKVVHPLKVAINYSGMKIGYCPAPSNLNDIKNFKIQDDLFVMNYNNNTIIPIWTKEYIEWRFLKYPNSEYHFVDKDDVFAVARVGFRGKVKECCILYINPKQGKYTKKMVTFVVKKLCNETRCDIITYASTLCDPVCKLFGRYFKVHSRGNFTYKFINEETPTHIDMMLPNINSHTY